MGVAAPHALFVAGRRAGGLRLRGHHPLQSEKQRVPGTPSTLARTDQSCVRDARAREATCPPSPARPEEPNTTGRGAFLARVWSRSSVARFRSGEEAAQSLHNLGVIDPLGCPAAD